jgi:NTP pyrophosphatase (non-canonical NTP hydrolase)
MKSKDIEALVITMEECGELVQACSKMIRSDGKKKYYKNLQDEAGDVYCLLQVLIQRGIINEAGLKEREQEKLHKLKKWSKLFEE